MSPRRGTAPSRAAPSSACRRSPAALTGARTLHSISRTKLATLLTLLPFTAAAQSSPGARPLLPEEIVVTATRTEEPAREVPASISTIGRAEWEKRGALFIGNELAEIPGLVLQRNDSGTYTSLTLR